MFRISKLTDYATVVLALLAEREEGVTSAAYLAAAGRLEATTVAKLLRALVQAGLVESFRGSNGGYRLARAAASITVADIIAAMEGPLGVTECSTAEGVCDHERHCGLRSNWRRVSDAVLAALREVSLAEMLPQPSRPGIPVALIEN